MCESPVDRDAPVMLAWNTFKATDEYANAARWALSPEDTEGSLWRAFLEGFTAAAATATAVKEATERLRTDCMVTREHWEEGVARLVLAVEGLP